jgi:predicted nuclease of predicted toxin-antitoxin system
VKFKIDQNLPAEYAILLREAGFEADSVDDEGLASADDGFVSNRARAEGRALLSLDLGFADIRAYPPQEYLGIIVVRSKAQDKITLLSMLRRLIPALRERSPEGQLWIVESDRIRFREG